MNILLNNNKILISDALTHLDILREDFNTHPRGYHYNNPL